MEVWVDVEEPEDGLDAAGMVALAAIGCELHSSSRDGLDETETLCYVPEGSLQRDDQQRHRELEVTFGDETQGTQELAAVRSWHRRRVKGARHIDEEPRVGEGGLKHVLDGVVLALVE